MVKTTVDVNDKVWKAVRIKASRDGITVPEALERIIETFIKDYGKEIGYNLE